MKFDYVVYKLTFPNGKIYIGKDIGGDGHSLRYFGSWSDELVESDFTKEELSNFVIKKEILFESKSKEEIGQKEREYILLFHSNDIEVGYNQTHRRKIN